MTTTAKLRAAAADFETMMQWEAAAIHYDAAADVYPAGNGTLRDNDITALRLKAMQCRAFLRITTQTQQVAA